MPHTFQPHFSPLNSDSTKIPNMGGNSQLLQKGIRQFFTTVILNLTYTFRKSRLWLTTLIMSGLNFCRQSIKTPNRNMRKCRCWRLITLESIWGLSMNLLRQKNNQRELRKKTYTLSMEIIYPCLLIVWNIKMRPTLVLWGICSVEKLSMEKA